MADYFLVLNPYADRWGANKTWPRLEAVLKARQVDYEVVRTEEPGHGIALAYEAARSGRYRAIVAVGGDGTVNEVANGLCRAATNGTTLPMGIFPVGSGNDLAEVLRIPRDLEGMVEHLLQDRRRLLDAGLVQSPGLSGVNQGGRYFVNNCGIGFEAQVSLESRRISRCRGFLIYLVAVFRALYRYVQPYIRVRWDGKAREGRMLLITVGNGRRTGGGFWLTPFAEVDDGQLDVGFAKALSRPGILRLLPKAIKGEHIYDPAILLDRFRRMVVQTDVPVPIHTDGEPITAGVQEIEVQVLPGKVWVVADPDVPLLDVFQGHGPSSEQFLFSQQETHRSSR